MLLSDSKLIGGSYRENISRACDADSEGEPQAADDGKQIKTGDE